MIAGYVTIHYLYNVPAWHDFITPQEKHSAFNIYVYFKSLFLEAQKMHG